MKRAILHGYSMDVDFIKSHNFFIGIAADDGTLPASKDSKN